MYYTFTIPREEFDETNVDRSMILRLIAKHYSIRAPEILKMLAITLVSMPS